MLSDGPAMNLMPGAKWKARSGHPEKFIFGRVWENGGTKLIQMLGLLVIFLSTMSCITSSRAYL